jgi:hypothetical protein
MTGAFGAKTVPAAQRYFFPSIRILNTDTATTGRIISMYNCMITNINHDRLDYGSADPVVWSVQFQPEQVNLEIVNNDTVELPPPPTDDLPTTPANLTPSNFTP